MSKTLKRSYSDISSLEESLKELSLNDIYLEENYKDFDILKILEKYEEQSYQDKDAYEELFKLNYEKKTKESDIECEKGTEASLEKQYHFNKKLFDTCLKITETLKDNLDITQNLINNESGLSETLDPILFIENLFNLYNTKIDEIKKIANEQENVEDYMKIMEQTKTLEKDIEILVRNKSIIDKEYFESLLFFKEIVIKYEKLITKYYDTSSVVEYMIMLKQCIEIYDNTYSMLYSEYITIEKINNNILTLIFILKSFRDILCSTAYKLSNISSDFKKEEIYKKNVNVEKCVNIISLIEDEEEQKKIKKQKTILYKISQFYNYIKTKSSEIFKIFPQIVQESGKMMAFAGNCIVKAMTYKSNNEIFNLSIKGIQKEVSEEFTKYLFKNNYKFDLYTKYSNYLLPGESVLSTETYKIITLIQIIAIILCKTFSTQTKVWKIANYVTEKIINYINIKYDVKFIKNYIEKMRTSFSCIYTTLGYYGKYIIDSTFTNFVYSNFTFICGRIVQFVSYSFDNTTNVLKSLCTGFKDAMFDSVFNLQSYLNTTNVDILNDNKVDKMIDNIILNGIDTIKEDYVKNSNKTYYLGLFNPFNITHNLNIETVFSTTKTAVAGTIIGNILNDISNDKIIKEINIKIDDITNINDINNFQGDMELFLNQKSDNINKLTNLIINNFDSNNDIITQDSIVVIENNLSDDKTKFKNELQNLQEKSNELLKINLSNELYKILSENIKKNKNIDDQNKYNLLELLNNEKYYKDEKENINIFKQLLNWIYGILNSLKQITLKELVDIIKNKAEYVAKYSYKKIKKGIKFICTTALNLPNTCYNSLSAMNIRIIYNRLSVSIISGCTSMLNLSLNFKDIYNFVQYVLDMNYILYKKHKIKLPPRDPLKFMFQVPKTMKTLDLAKKYSTLQYKKLIGKEPKQLQYDKKELDKTLEEESKKRYKKDDIIV
jgi:hypothetical protein